jgi:hypothetical protein
MKPLISGAEAKRYITPTTDTYLLFPYAISEDSVRLIDKTTMEDIYPKAWAYLKSYKNVLRMREAQQDQEGKVIERPLTMSNGIVSAGTKISSAEDQALTAWFRPRSPPRCTQRR